MPDAAQPDGSGVPSATTILTDGELVVVGRIRSASNAALVCDAVADDGTELRCVYKPVRGEVPLWDFPDGTLAGREVASYLISDALGWSVIPETVMRDGPAGPGMVQRWVDTVDDADGGQARLDLVDLCPPELQPEDFKAVLEAYTPAGDPVVLVHADDPRLQRMAVLDVVLNNADRKGGHVLEGVDGGVYGIDHGICLHSENKLRTVLWGWAGDRIPGHLLADLASLADALGAGGAVRERLAGLITDTEIAEVAARCARLVDAGVMPHPPGRRPIPWPPF